MKRYLAIVVLFIPAIIFGQVQKGDNNIGANLGMMIHNGDEDLLNYSNTYFSLNYQYYVTNNISLGFAPSVTSQKVFNDGIAVNTLGLNFFVDYNFLTKGGRVLPYIGFKYSSFVTTYKFDPDALVGAGFQLVDFLNFGDIIGPGEQVPFDLDEIKYKRGIASLTAGMKFFVTERVNIDNNFTIGKILSEKIDLGFLPEIKVPSDGMYLQFTVGFNYIIGRKKA